MNKLFLYDKKLLKKYDYIIGTDEAGRGPGAGPVYAAAVCFPCFNNNLISDLNGINDSKQLTEKKREEFFDIITNNSIFSVYQGSVEEIEKFNILRTSLMMMNKACNEVISKLDSENILVLTDGNKKIINFPYNQQTIIKGDGKSASIAAASIIAKVMRDKFMSEIDKQYPMYKWAKNKGYLTKEHLDAVDKFGLTKWHRKKFFRNHFEKAEQLHLI